MGKQKKIPRISKRFKKILKGRGRGKGEGLTITTGLTKGQGLASADPNLTLKPLNKRLVKGKKVFKKIFSSKGTKESDMAINNKKIFQTKDPESGRKKDIKSKELEFPKTKGPYKIKEGDTLSELAKDNNTTVAKLMKLNPGIKDPNKIRAGAGLKGIPVTKKKSNNTKDRDLLGDFSSIGLDAKKKKRKSRRKDSVFGMGVGFNRGGFVKSGDGDKFVTKAYGGKVGK